MWYMYKHVLKHPLRQDGHDRLNMDQQLPYFLHGHLFTLHNLRTFVVQENILLMIYGPLQIIQGI